MKRGSFARSDSRRGRRAQAGGPLRSGPRRTKGRAPTGSLAGLLAAAAAWGVVACGPSGQDGAGTDPLVKRGRAVYAANCTACHAHDPCRDGNLGPAIAGSSRELLEARVLHGTYPPGYAPKRDTKAMIPLPHLEGEIDALAAYLGAADCSG